MYKKADMHVHSIHSRWRHLNFINTRDSYSTPFDIYKTAKARGMDFVTITDHDSIDGCMEFLNCFPDCNDFFTGVEVETHIPDSTIWIHLNVYDFEEKQYEEVKRLQESLPDLLKYLKSENLLFCFNHFFQSYYYQLPPEKYMDFIFSNFNLFEVQNAAMPEAHDKLVKQLVNDNGGGILAGSDAHTLRRIAKTFTEAEGNNVSEFLSSIRKGNGKACGENSGSLAIMADAYQIVLTYYASLWGKKNYFETIPVRIKDIFLSLFGLPFFIGGLPIYLTLISNTKQKTIARKIRKNLY